MLDLPDIPLISPPQELPKDLLVIINPEPRLAIRYCPTESTDIYRLSRLDGFSPYISRILSQNHREKTIIVLYDSYASCLRTLHILYSLSGPTTDHTAKFLNAYRYYIQQIHPANATTIQPSKGENDRPVSFNLVLVLDSASLKSHPSRQSLQVQQFLRFVALKHGALVVVTHHAAGLLETPQELISPNLDPTPIILLQKLVQQKILAHIPLGWDLWSRIAILAKSAPHYNLWKSAEDIGRVNDEYNAFLEDKDANFTQLIHEFEPAKTTPDAEPRKDDMDGISLGELVKMAVFRDQQESS